MRSLFSYKKPCRKVGGAEAPKQKIKQISWSVYTTPQCNQNQQRGKRQTDRIHQHDSLEGAAAGGDEVHLCPPRPGRRVEQLLQHSGSRHRQCKQRQLVPNRPVQHVDLVFLMLFEIAVLLLTLPFRYPCSSKTEISPIGTSVPSAIISSPSNSAIFFTTPVTVQ